MPLLAETMGGRCVPRATVARPCSHVPQLQDHAAAGDTHSLGHDSPAFDLILVVNARR